MKNKKFEKMYRCMGLNLKDGYSQVWGSCGDVHSLGKWLELIYPHKTKEELIEYFADDTAAEIVDYIYSTASLRLVALKGK